MWILRRVMMMAAYLKNFLTANLKIFLSQIHTVRKQITMTTMRAMRRVGCRSNEQIRMTVIILMRGIRFRVNTVMDKT